MKNSTFGGYRSIRAFVKAKLQRFDRMEHNFANLFEMMFSEKENVLFEKSEGYRVVKTTYGESCERILRRCETLRTLLENAAYNSVVGIYMSNSPDWIEIFWTVLRCGYRPLLMNLRLDDTTLEHVLAQTDAIAVISDGKQFSIKTICCTDVVPAEAVGDAGDFGSEILLMSSGTSANVKLCAYTAEELYHQIKDSYQIILGCKQMQKHHEGQLKLLTFLPFYHVFGLMAMYIWFAFFSRTFVHLNDLMPQTIVNTIRRHKVTHIFAVPLFWQKVYAQAMETIAKRGPETKSRFDRGLRLAQKLEGIPVLGRAFRHVAFKEVRQNLFGDSVRFMITGGSMIGSNVLSFFNSIGYHLANGYGMTEIGITSVELSMRKKLLNAGFVGKPFSSVEYKISDDGELLVRGLAAAKYIIEGGTRTNRDGWFRTRDLAVCENGHYRLLGRLDDLVITATGENLNPNLIEPKLSLPSCRGVCLIADGGTAVLLVSVKKHMQEDALRKLEQDLKSRLVQLQLSSQIGKLVFMADPLMLEQEFKPNRRRLAESYRSGALTPVTTFKATPETEDDALFVRIHEMFAVALGKKAEDVSPQADFFLDEGGTSLDYFAMVSQLQEEFSVSFPTASQDSRNSVKELYDYIKVHKDNVDQIL